MIEYLTQFDPKSVSIGIVIFSIILAILMRRVLKVVGNFAANTKTQVDEIILGNIRAPIQVLIVTFGFFFAVKYSHLRLLLEQLPFFRYFQFYGLLQ